METGSFFKSSLDKVMVFDGGMGTCIQQYSLTIDDFAGQEGCNEYLVQTRPDVIQEIHAAYYAAGADVVETNTFGATPVVLAEYGLQQQAYALNKQAAQLAKKAAQDFMSQKPRYVAGSIGPTTKLPTLGHISFKALQQGYLPQIEGLIDGGADILLVETCQDLLQTKAALSAIHQVKRSKGVNLPVMVQVTIEATGTMLVGMDMLSVITALQPYDIDVLGMNCATGPQEMSKHIRTLSQVSPFYISCLPNAGIPENRGGHAHYHLTPVQLSEYLTHFIQDLGVSVVGGCCGTTPAHIQTLSEVVEKLTPARRTPIYTPSLTSLYSSTPMRQEPAPLIIGERTNANGSKKFRDLLQQEDYDALVTIAKSQVQEGAHLLDVCTAYVGRDEVRDMEETITRYNAQVDVPLMIDSTESPVIEAALNKLAGKAIVNSINLEDGGERLAQVLPLCREFGAAVVALTIDEVGMAKTAQSKLDIAKRIYQLAVHEYGIQPTDLVFDTLTFTLGSGDEEFRKAGVETIEAIRLIKQELPGVQTVLGISNISFGLKSAVRHVLNSVFLHYALEAGLDMAIINSKHIMPLFQISEQERELCRQLIFDERRDGFDPLMALIEYYEANDASGRQREKVVNVIPAEVEERLKYRIIHGEKSSLEEDLKEALTIYTALDIINIHLLDGMKTVGELFGKGEMQLPFVLQSAEVMKAAVAYLEPFMQKTEGNTAKGIIVLGTVQGDVHDIGKNLVDIILTNNGYQVHNLGIKQPIEDILKAVVETDADAVGMSGLLVKSTAIMKDNLTLMQERGLRLPVILGGAALTRQFVEHDCQQIYDGKVYYAKDAFAGLAAMGEVMGIIQPIEVKVAEKVAVTSDGAPVYQSVGSLSVEPAKTYSTQRSAVREDVAIPSPPFWGTRIVSDIALTDVYPFLNQQALIAGQWQVKRGTKTSAEHEAFLKESVYPALEMLKAEAITAGWLKPQVVYGYFSCQSDKNDLLVYDVDQQTVIQRFSFPRGGQQGLCLADYFASVDSGRMDVLALQLVTVGSQATQRSLELFEANQYKDYLFSHGFSVEMAEALAEYWHAQVRHELNIHHQDTTDKQRLFAQGYQGSRFSFGYPACPNLADQVQLCQLLQPERIGVQLTEEFMLDPEQSTSALIVHHPEARYFDVRG